MRHERSADLRALQVYILLLWFLHQDIINKQNDATSGKKKNQISDIWVFMYLGQVCNLRAGTRVCASLNLHTNQRFCAEKSRMETRFVETLAYLKYSTLLSNTLLSGSLE